MLNMQKPKKGRKIIKKPEIQDPELDSEQKNVEGELENKELILWKIG